MTYEIRELSLGGILDQAIKLSKDRFGLFFSIIGVLYLPALLVVQSIPLLLIYFGVDLGGAFGMLIVIYALLIFQLLIIWPISNAALIYAIARIYLDEPVTLGEAYRKSFSVFGKLLGTNVIKGLIVVLGLIMCVLPGLVAIFALYFTDCIVVLEGTAGGPALQRSRALMKGQWGTAFVLGFIVAVISGCLGAVAGLAPTVFLRLPLQVALQGAAMILASSAVVVMYFSTRCKVEQFDLAVLAQAVDRGSRPDEA